MIPGQLEFATAGNIATPDASATLALIREIYEKIYRISNVDDNESYKRVLEFLKTDGP